MITKERLEEIRKYVHDHVENSVSDWPWGDDDRFAAAEMLRGLDEIIDLAAERIDNSR